MYECLYLIKCEPERKQIAYVVIQLNESSTPEAWGEEKQSYF